MLVQSTTALPLGTSAPNFALLNPVTDKIFTLGDIASPKATVIMFLSNHCPYVKHILDALIKVAAEYQAKGVSFAGINSNDAEAYPADSPAQMKLLAQQKHIPFPYLYDHTQQIARAYRAECTPELYVFDKNLKLAYHGQFDSTRPNSEIPANGQHLRQVLDALLADEPVTQEQKPSMGCNIKWRHH